MAADEKMKGGKCQKHKWQLKPVQVEFSSQGFPYFFVFVLCKNLHSRRADSWKMKWKRGKITTFCPNERANWGRRSKPSIMEMG